MDWKEKIYEKYLTDLKEKIIKVYEETDRKASGDFGNIEVVTTPTSAHLTGAPHSYFVEQGRAPGKFPPPDAIRQWIEDKGTFSWENDNEKNSLVYLISKKIAEQGTPGSDVLTSVVQEFIANDFPRMMGELGTEIAARFSNDIVGLLKQN